MVSDEVTDLSLIDAVIESDDEIDVVDEIDDSVDATEGPAETSELERMCSEYLADPNRPKSFFDRFAMLMNRDERVRKICRVRALKSRASLNEVDEVLQRVLIVFFTSQLPKMREAEAIYAVIYSIATNVSREVVRDSQVLSTNHDSIEELRDRGVELEQVGLMEHVDRDHDQEIDSKAAAAKLTRAFQMHQNGEMTLNTTHGVYQHDPLIQTTTHDPVIADLGNDPVIVAEAKPRVRVKKDTVIDPNKLSADQKELVEICEHLGLRNQDFAAALGIGLPRLSSYIYGRTATVPEDIMTLARELRDEDPQAAARANRFNRTMSDILDGWAYDLGIIKDAENRDQMLADRLGVTKMTIHRWRNNATKPDRTALVRYEQVVARYVEQMQELRGKAKA